MRKSSNKLSVGIFVVVGTVLLITALFLVGKQQHLFSKSINLYSVFADVSGLQEGNNVRYSGVNVGTVSKIEMTAEGKITVEMAVDEDAAQFIKKDAVASISSDGLVGSMVVNLAPGTNTAAKKVASGDWIQVKSKITVDEIMETFSKTNESAALITSDLATITNRVVSGQGALGAILSDVSLENDVRNSITGLKRTAEGANQAVAQVNAMISKINYDQSAAAVLLSDPKTRTQIQNVFTNLEKSSRDINSVSSSLDAYVTEIKTSKGALNLLAKDEGMAKNIDSTIVNVKEATDKMNQNMEALKHNFLFRGYFRRLERKQKQDSLDLVKQQTRLKY